MLQNLALEQECFLKFFVLKLKIESLGLPKYLIFTKKCSTNF